MLLILDLLSGVWILIFYPSRHFLIFSFFLCSKLLSLFKIILMLLWKKRWWCEIWLRFFLKPLDKYIQCSWRRVRGKNSKLSLLKVLQPLISFSVASDLVQWQQPLVSVSKSLMEEGKSDSPLITSMSTPLHLNCLSRLF